MRRGRRRSDDAVVELLADQVDAEGDESDAEARSGVAELIRKHGVLPPLVPPPEKLSGGSQRLAASHFSLCLCFSFLLFS